MVMPRQAVSRGHDLANLTAVTRVSLLAPRFVVAGVVAYLLRRRSTQLSYITDNNNF